MYLFGGGPAKVAGSHCKACTAMAVPDEQPVPTMTEHAINSTVTKCHSIFPQLPLFTLQVQASMV